MLLISIFIVNFLIIVIIYIYNRLTCGICKCSRHLFGKVAIVTGANNGIGFYTAKDFAERGARVILGCRNEVLGTAARDQIIKLTGNTDVSFQPLDLASLKSVRKFADIIIHSEKRVDILVNNAGVYDVPYEKTEDGLPQCIQINHFGPFLLTKLLLPLLTSSAPSRIINVSSAAHRQGKIDFGNLNFEKDNEETYSKMQAYNNSKLFNILITQELGRRLQGSGVTANSLHPGVVHTNILPSYGFWFIGKFLLRPVMKNCWEGAQTTIYLAVSPDVERVSGRYFSDCRERELYSSAQGKSEEAKKLWEVSERLVKLN